MQSRLDGEWPEIRDAVANLVQTARESRPELSAALDFAGNARPAVDCYDD